MTRKQKLKEISKITELKNTYLYDGSDEWRVVRVYKSGVKCFRSWINPYYGTQVEFKFFSYENLLNWKTLCVDIRSWK
jgi:hypothetical protein